MAADRFDLAEGVVKLVGNAQDFQDTLDDLEKSVQDHETKITSITWKAAQLRAEKIKQVAERSNREVRRFQEAGLYGNRTSLLLEQQRMRAEKERIQFVKESARFGEQAARRFASERVSREEEKGPLIRTRGVQDFLDTRREQKEEKRNQRLVDAFRFGRVGGAIVGAGRSFNEGLKQATPLAVGGAAVGAGAMGLASAASPLMASTLSESLTNAAAKIGRDFVPAVLELSFSIQKLGNWWSELDSTTKKVIVSTTKLVAISGVSILALGGITKAIGAVAALLTTHPILAGLALGTGIVGGVMVGGANRANNNQDAKDIAMLGGGGLVGAGIVAARGIVRRADAIVNPKKDGEGGMLGSFGPSSFSSLQDFYRKVLLDSTGGSEIQADTLKVQTQVRDEIIGLRADLKGKPGVVQ